MQHRSDGDFQQVRGEGQPPTSRSPPAHREWRGRRLPRDGNRAGLSSARSALRRTETGTHIRGRDNTPLFSDSVMVQWERQGTRSNRDKQTRPTPPGTRDRGQRRPEQGQHRRPNPRAPTFLHRDTSLWRHRSLRWSADLGRRWTGQERNPDAGHHTPQCTLLHPGTPAQPP